MYQTIILPVAVDPDAARSGGRGILFFRKLASVSKRADADGSEGHVGDGGGGVSNTFFTRQEDEGRDRKKKERKKEVQIPTGERRNLKFVERRLRDGCYDADSVDGALLHYEGPNGRIRGRGFDPRVITRDARNLCVFVRDSRA